MAETKDKLSKLYLKVKRTPETITFDEVSKELWGIIEEVDSISDILKQKDKTIERLKAENCELHFELQRIKLEKVSVEELKTRAAKTPEYLKD
jgi:uncharacterized protein YaaN involved in tellurite resistance